MNQKPLIEMISIATRSQGDLEILASKTKHAKSVLYFHGFPGPFEKLPEGELRIADQLYDVMSESHNFYYPLYTTVKTGFNFEDSIRNGEKAYTFLHNERPSDPVTIIGQSWGAVIALQLAKKVKAEKLILIVPFLFLPQGNAALKMVQSFSSRFPDLLTPEAIEEYAAQLNKLAVNGAPVNALRELKTDVTIIVAERDELVPVDKVRSAVTDLPNVKLIVLEKQSHSIEDRGELRRIFKREFAG